VQGDITAEDNEATFHNDVQKYVDVMNLMTDGHVSDSTYREQFYFELNKGQLFRSINKFEMAYELFDHLDDCDLDSLEQSVLNIWLLQTASDISIHSQLNGGITLDSISFEIDTTGVNIPMSYLANTYYFGAIIESPNSISYVPCSIAERRSMVVEAESPNYLFPNPSTGMVHISYSDEAAFTTVSVTDVTGKQVFTTSKHLEKYEIWTMNLENIVSPGNYFLTLSNKFMRRVHSFVIE
jgi:hypothetical protein